MDSTPGAFWVVHPSFRSWSNCPLARPRELGSLSVKTPKVTAGHMKGLSTNTPRVTVRFEIACAGDKPMSWVRVAAARRVPAKSYHLYLPAEFFQVRVSSTIRCWN